MAEIKRNLQTDGGLYIDKWWTGLYKNRSPLFAPVSAMGITLITRRDALIDGENVMLTPQFSLKRRYGHSKACSVAFGAGEWPLGFVDFQKLDGSIITLADTQTNVYTFAAGSKTSIYTKSAGAAQSSFNSVLDWLYWVDGVDAKKFDGTTVWNMGLTAPTIAPSISVTESGAASASWIASCFFSTMGLIVDPNGYAQQLVGISGGIAVGANGVYGTSAVGSPAWNQTDTGTTSDNTVTWRNLGTIPVWSANTSYITETHAYGANAGICCVYDPLTDTFQMMIASSNGTSGANRPNFSTIAGVAVYDNQCRWMSLGTRASMPNGYGYGNWTPSTPVAAPPGPTRVIEPWNILPTVGGGAVIWLQEPSTGGTTSSGSGSLVWNDVLGGLTSDVNTTTGSTLTWACCGDATWASLTAYRAWTSATTSGFNVVKDANGSLWVCIKSGTSGNSDPFRAAGYYWPASTSVTANVTRIIDSNSNVQLCTSGGTTGSSAPTWATTQGSTTSDNGATWTNQGPAYGIQVADGTVSWVNVGKSASWVASQKYYLPTSGFTVPGNTTPYGSAVILDTSNNIEYVVQSGVTGSSAPSWGSANTYTVDNGAVWYNNGAQAASSLSWTSGYVYAYSYKSRATTDYYSVPVNGVLPSAPGYGPLPAPTGSADGNVSTASPITTLVGANPGAVNSLKLTGSLDPQVDTIVIWRSKDGGSEASMFELTEIPNPPAVNAYTPGTVTFLDTQPDSILNTLIVAPINGVNDPPPTGLSLLTWYGGRLWGAAGNILYFSGGPDTNPGSGTQCWPPANNFPVPGNITALIPTSSGLIISVSDDLWIVQGTTSATFTVPILWQSNFGVPSQNAFALDGDNVIFYTSKGQVWQYSSSGWQEIGLENEGQFAAMTPSSVYVAMHRSGADEGLFISDGSANIYRYNHTSLCWDTPMRIVGGASAIASIETSAANWSLLVGRASGAGYILKRDTSLFTDDASAYACNVTIGSIVIAPPRQTVIIESVLLQAPIIGTYPTVSVMLNEISDTGTFPATFTALPNPVVDPPQLVGYQNTIWMKRHDLKAAGIPLPQYVQHMQVKVDFGTDTVANELYAIGLA